MKLTDLIPRSAIVVPLQASDVEGALGELAGALAGAHGLDAAKVRELLTGRESLGSTALGDRIAVPHARDDIARTVGALGVSRAGIDWDAPDGAPVHLLVALLSPMTGSEHLTALAVVGRRLGDPGLCEALLAASDAAGAHRLITDADATPP